MKNVVVISSCSEGSCGKIARKLNKYLQDHGYNSIFYYARGEEKNDRKTIKFESDFEVNLHGLLCRLTGIEGVYSNYATHKLIRMLDKQELDAIYVVSLHGYYLNANKFLKYIGKRNLPLVYISGDEFPAWGKCGYRSDCERYLNECRNCPQFKEYPNSWFFDRAHDMYINKKDAYSTLKRVAFIGPEFTINQMKKSPLLADKKLIQIDECVDVDFYTPRDTTTLKKELSIADDKIVIVCVAPMSNPRKGCKYFIEAARKLENDQRFVFVHVGYNISDKSNLPSNYIPIGYLSNQEQLAQFYSLGDLFVFPSLLDTMPNSCLEAMSAGTPLLCFNISGMPFLAPSNICTLVEPTNVEQLVDVIMKTKKKTNDVIELCRNYAVNRYDNKKYHQRLIEIAESL